MTESVGLVAGMDVRYVRGSRQRLGTSTFELRYSETSSSSAAPMLRTASAGSSAEPVFRAIMSIAAADTPPITTRRTKLSIATRGVQLLPPVIARESQ